MQRKDVEEIQYELGSKVYRARDILDNPKVTEILQLFSRYYFKTGTFAAGKNLVYILKVKHQAF